MDASARENIWKVSPISNLCIKALVRLVPCGVFRADGVFAELAGAFHLADPCVNIVGDAQGT